MLFSPVSVCTLVRYFIRLRIRSRHDIARPIVQAFTLKPFQQVSTALTLALALFVYAAVTPAARQLPKDAEFAKAAEFNYPYFKIGKGIFRLAVGSRIYNEQNLIIMPAAAPSKANVLYKTDFNGEISAVWILSDEDAKPYLDRLPRPPPKENRQ